MKSITIAVYVAVLGWAGAPWAHAASAILPGAPPSHFDAVWAQRQAALANRDAALAQRHLEQLLDDKQQSGWPDMPAFASALMIEARAHMRADHLETALSLAHAAVTLAPHDLRTHVLSAQIDWQQYHNVRSAWQLGWHGVQQCWREWPVQKWLLRIGFATTVCGLLIALCGWLIWAWRRHGNACLQALASVTRINRDAWHGKTLVVLWLIGLLLLPIALGAGIVTTLVVWTAAMLPFVCWQARCVGLGLVGLFLAMWIPLPEVLAVLTQPAAYGNDLYVSVRDVHGNQAMQRLHMSAPQDPSTLFARAWRARWSGDLAAAKSAITDAQDHRGPWDKSSAAEWIFVGNLAWADDQSDAAVAAYKRALQQEPRNVVAMFNLSRVYFARAVQPDASILYAQAMQTDATAVDIMQRHVAHGHSARVVDPDVTRALPITLGTWSRSQWIRVKALIAAPHALARALWRDPVERACVPSDSVCRTAWRRGVVWLWGDRPQ